MLFGDDNFETILPAYLSSSEKDRLKVELKQFTAEERGNGIIYNSFYKTHQNSHFLQSDLIRQVRFASWNDDTGQYDKEYQNAIIVSNTCDISDDNDRSNNVKECLFAPLIDFNEYLNDLKLSGYNGNQIESISNNIKAQLSTNIFYLPFCQKEKREYIALLDNIFWFPSSELNTYIETIEQNRIASLSHFGFYLFILKLSYHFCRLPEDQDRGDQNE